MTRAQALAIVTKSIDDYGVVGHPVSVALAERVVNALDEALTLEPTVVELSATLKGVGRMSHGD